MPQDFSELPEFTSWPTFPFEGNFRVRRLDDAVDVEPERQGEGDQICHACESPDSAYIWVADRWRVRAMDRPSGLPMVLILESRSHLDLGDLPNLLAAELGVMTVRLERAIRSLEGVARVHVNRWGDGSAHLHLWFLARPYGRLQLRGTFLSLWDDILPPIDEVQWRENLGLVAAWLADFGGRSLADAPHIDWQAPSSLGGDLDAMVESGFDRAAAAAIAAAADAAESTQRFEPEVTFTEPSSMEPPYVDQGARADAAAFGDGFDWAARPVDDATVQVSAGPGGGVLGSYGGLDSGPSASPTTADAGFTAVGPAPAAAQPGVSTEEGTGTPSLAGAPPVGASSGLQPDQGEPTTRLPDESAASEGTVRLKPKSDRAGGRAPAAKRSAAANGAAGNPVPAATGGAESVLPDSESDPTDRFGADSPEAGPTGVMGVESAVTDPAPGLSTNGPASDASGPDESSEPATAGESAGAPPPRVPAARKKAAPRQRAPKASVPVGQVAAAAQPAEAGATVRLPPAPDPADPEEVWQQGI